MTNEVALMVVRAGDLDVGLDAARVQEVLPLAQWNGEAALDLLQQVGATGAAGDARILVVTRQGREPLAALVSGAVTLRHIARADMLPLPPELRAHVAWLSHVVISEGQTPLLVVDTERLGR